MYNELFVSQNGESLFLEILSEYVQLTSRGFVKVLKMRETTRDLLKLPPFPFMVGFSGEIMKGEINLAEILSKMGGVYDVLFGRTEDSHFKHIDFIRYFKETACNKNSALNFLNTHLLSNTFCNGYHITISDLFAYAHIVLLLQSISDEEKLSYCNIVRWVDHIQNLKGIKERVRELKLRVMLPFEPLFLEPNVEPVKASKAESKKVKAEDKKPQDKPVEKAQEVKPIVIEAVKEVKENKEVKQNKPEAKADAQPKKQEQKQPSNKNAKKEDDCHPISKLDIRVGKVISIHVNEKSEKLFNEEIDLGNGEIRKIASGLKGRVDIEDLRDSYVIVLANLKPRTLCEWTSHGMILCASDENGNIEPIRPPAGSKPGDAITIGEYPRQPVPELNPKKSPWEQVSSEVFVNADKYATYQGTSIWRTESGIVGTKVLTGGKIS